MKSIFYFTKGLPIMLTAILCSCSSDKSSDNSKTTVSIDSLQLKKETKMTPSFKSGYAEINDIKMYYEIYGQGNPIVLIHGGGSTIQSSFSKIIPLLAKQRQVIGVELQAHGRTGDRNKALSFQQDADDVVALLTFLKIAKADILGFSNGGNTALQIAINHPQIVNKLILASTFYKREGLPMGFFDMMKKATINDMPQSLKTAFLQVNDDTNALQTMFDKDKERMIEFKDWKDDDIRNIKAPTLIINGDHDVIQNSHTVAMANLIEKSRLMILPAEHGAYMGVLESPSPKGNMLEFCVDTFENFLNN